MTPAQAQEFSFDPARQPQRTTMTGDYLHLPIGDKAPEVVTAVIEIPQDSVNKYEYDRHLQVFRLDRNLHSPIHYPGDYGFIPRTLAEDGDPLDILVLGDAPTFPGCVYHARPIGLFEMLDQGVPDEKILAYATGNPRFSSIGTYSDVMPHILREVEHFFSVYKNLEGKRTEVLGWGDREAAYKIIRSSHERFEAAIPVGSGTR
jgi:inorganic pyrophosphatase